MSETFETYRGAVAASECDAFGHLNIAFYPDRFEAAALDALERLRVPGAWRTSRLDTTYRKELCAGEGLIVRSTVRANEPGAIFLQHEVMTPSGAPTTEAEHRLMPSPSDGPPSPPLDLIAMGEGRLPSGRDRILPGEQAADGIALSAYVRRFSDACLIAIEAIGMTPAYRSGAKRGFATFETRLALEFPPPRVGEGVAVASGMVEVGSSSLRLIHTMRATNDGRLLARFYQAGVHFDLERRRGAPWPTELRGKALALRSATA